MQFKPTQKPKEIKMKTIDEKEEENKKQIINKIKAKKKCSDEAAEKKYNGMMNILRENCKSNTEEEHQYVLNWMIDIL